MTTITDKEFTDVYNDNKNILNAFVCKILKDPDETQNVVHDTFMKLLKQDYSKIKDHLKQWLFTVSRNQAIRVYHKRNRTTSLKDDFEEDLIDETPSVSETMMDTELKSQIPNLLKVLNERRKKAIIDRFYKNHSYEQIGKKFKISKGNVGFQLNFAINAMRKEFAKLNKKFVYK